MNFLTQIGAWRDAKQYEQQNPNMLRRVGMNRPQGESMVRPLGFNRVISYQPAQSPIGRPVSQEAVGYANYRNQVQQSDPIVRGFASYLGRNNLANADVALRDFEAGRIDPYAQYLPAYEGWRIRETKRGNANGLLSSTFGRLLTTLGPALVTGGAALPMMGRVATGAAFGGMAGGPLGAVTGGLSAGVAPSIRLPGFRAAISAPAQAASSIAQQFANPATLGRQLASTGIGKIGGRK